MKMFCDARETANRNVGVIANNSGHHFVAFEIDSVKYQRYSVCLFICIQLRFALKAVHLTFLLIA